MVHVPGKPHAEIAKFDPVVAALFDHNQAFSKTKCFMMLLMLPNPVQIGVKIPHTYSKAVKFDTENGNTLWQDATALELSQLCDYHCFSDVGPHTTLPSDHHQISVQFVYDVKEDGHHKVLGISFLNLKRQSMLGLPLSAAYGLSPFLLISINHTLCKAILAMLTLNLSYLESFSHEKVGFTAGPEFGPLYGHTMIIIKVLYGLHSSGLHFHKELADTLQAMDFPLC